MSICFLECINTPLDLSLLLHLFIRDMEKVNSELLSQNCYIMEQNERLKKAAELLQQERQKLLSQLNARTISASDHHQGGKDKHKRPAGAGSSSPGAGAGAGASAQASSESE